MIMRLLGYSAVDFLSDDGSPIKGVSLYVAFEDDHVEGERTERLFVKHGIALPKLAVGDYMDVGFNMRGKVESIASAKQ